MCGFAGFCDPCERFAVNGKEIAGRMAAKIKHRGPDSGGGYSDSFLSAGFCRLKIIDAEKGDQPMFSADGRYMILFNGEIYNYRSLKKSLFSDHGVRFSTESDTEVLLAACICYGEDVFRFLRGMYSFVFYDRYERRALLARDPFGIKPLYYGFFDGCLLFASEIKAMLAHPLFTAEFDCEVLPYYLQFQYVPTENTAFKGVKRLLPGHFMTISDKGGVIRRYFELPRTKGGKTESYRFSGAGTAEAPLWRSERGASKTITRALGDSVSLHCRADTEVGAFLSGGVDSAFVCALARPEKLYTAAFADPGFDERPEARRTAAFIGGRLVAETITPESFFAAVPNVQYHSDEPYANLSAVPLYLIARRASEDVKVLLSGEGADELFGGYEWYLDSPAGKLYRRLPRAFRRVAAKKMPGGRLGAFLERNAGDTEETFIGQARIMSAEEAYSLLSEPYKALRPHTDVTVPIYDRLENPGNYENPGKHDAHTESDIPGESGTTVKLRNRKISGKASALDKKLWLDRNLWLPCDILNKADKMTMASSVELRVPYLDLRVLGAAQTLPESSLVRGKVTKYALRRAASEVLPEETALAPKKGFPVPIRNWLRRERFRSEVLSALESDTGRKFFDVPKLKALLEAHHTGTANHARVIYTVYAFIKWYDVFFPNGEKATSGCEFSADEEHLFQSKTITQTAPGTEARSSSSNEVTPKREFATDTALLFRNETITKTVPGSETPYVCDKKNATCRIVGNDFVSGETGGKDTENAKT